MKTWKHFTVVTFLIIVVIVAAFTACDNGDTTNTHTISFDADNGSAVTTQKVNEGNKVTKPTNPTKGAWCFDYWFDVTTNTEWDFNTTVTTDITLKAKWIIKVQDADVFRYNDLNEPSTISGTVILEMYITGSDPIMEEIGSVESGKLNFILPETLTANDWRSIYQAPSDRSVTYDSNSDSKNHYRYDYTVDSDTVSINPSDAKMISLQIRVVSSTNTKYYLDCFNDTTTTTGSISTNIGAYMYFGYHDKQVTVSGEVDTTTLYTYFNDNNRTRTQQNKTVYDWILTQGWNIYYENWEQITDNSDPNAVSITFSSNTSTNHSFINIAGLKWVIS